jgi:hypothetical protein
MSFCGFVRRGEEGHSSASLFRRGERRRCRLQSPCGSDRRSFYSSLARLPAFVSVCRALVEIAPIDTVPVGEDLLVDELVG